MTMMPNNLKVKNCGLGSSHHKCSLFGCLWFIDKIPSPNSLMDTANSLDNSDSHMIERIPFGTVCSFDDGVMFCLRGYEFYYKTGNS